MLKNVRIGAWSSNNNEFTLPKHCLLVMRDPGYYPACTVLPKGLIGVYVRKAITSMENRDGVVISALARWGNKYNNHPNANSFLHGAGFPMRHDWLCSLLYWSFFYILVSPDLFSLFLRTADFENYKNGHHIVESIRQRETNFNQAQLRHRDVSSIASNFSLFWTKFWQVRKCLCQIKLKSSLFWLSLV